jgi:hypothetical protein
MLARRPKNKVCRVVVERVVIEVMHAHARRNRSVMRAVNFLVKPESFLADLTPEIVSDL